MNTVPPLLVSVVARTKNKEWFLIPDQELRDAVRLVLQDAGLDAYMRSVFPLLSEANAVQPMFESEFTRLLFAGIEKADRRDLLRLLAFPGRYNEYRELMLRTWPNGSWRKAA